jgi:hypothetical protein
MDDQADVGDVDAHAERIGADDPGQLGLKVITEPLEQVFLFLRAERAVALSQPNGLDMLFFHGQPWPAGVSAGSSRAHRVGQSASVRR